MIAQLAFGESFHQVETGKIHPVASALTTLSNVRPLSSLLPRSLPPSSHLKYTGTSPLPALCRLEQSISGGAFIALQHWIQRCRPSYQHALRTYNDYFASRVEYARERIRDGGEIAEIQCLVSSIFAPVRAERLSTDESVVPVKQPHSD